MRLGRGRRFAVAAISLACAALLFRTHVASALVARGDDLLQGGDVNGAVRAYARAARLDGHATDAADRLAFYLMIRGADGDALRALRIAEGALAVAPHDARLLADRGFAAERLHRWAAAESSFAAAGAAARDPRYFHLAARMAQRARRTSGMRAELRAALAIDAAYQPASAALRSLTP